MKKITVRSRGTFKIPNSMESTKEKILFEKIQKEFFYKLLLHHTSVSNWLIWMSHWNKRYLLCLFHYSPNLTPTCYHLFYFNALWQFQSIKNVPQKFIKSKLETFFYNQMHNLSARWCMIIEIQGKYFDSWIMMQWIYINERFFQKV